MSLRSHRRHDFELEGTASGAGPLYLTPVDAPAFGQTGRVMSCIGRLDLTENNASSAEVLLADGSRSDLASTPVDNDVFYESRQGVFAGGSDTVAGLKDPVAAVGGAYFNVSVADGEKLTVGALVTATGAGPVRLHVTFQIETWRT